MISIMKDNLHSVFHYIELPSIITNVSIPYIMSMRVVFFTVIDCNSQVYRGASCVRSLLLLYATRHCSGNHKTYTVEKIVVKRND